MKKPVWYTIGIVYFLISVIGRMTNSVSDVLIAICIIAFAALGIWLFETGRISMNEHLGKMLKKIGVGIVVVVGMAYIAMMVGFSLYRVAAAGDWQGIAIVGIAGVVIGVLWYISRWRRWWVKFLKTFMPKDKIHPGDWKMCEKYFWTFDYETNTQYGLRPSDGIFDGRARVWLAPNDVDKDASARLDSFEVMLVRRNIEANCALVHIPGCIYADIVAETNYKSMDSNRLAAFREAFHELDEMNYQGDYYVEYHGELGSILFESTSGSVTRAIRTEPREEYYLDLECGFYSEEASYFIDRGIDWTEGSYSLISEENFFTRWRERLDYEDKDDAYSFFESASLMYFAAVTNGNKKEQANSRWDVEYAAKYLIAHNEAETMIELMSIHEQAMYWGARLFVDVVPEYAHSTANWLVENSENPEIVLRVKRLLTQWKGGKR